MWCTVELKTSKGTKEYVASSKMLQTELGDPVTERDLTFGNAVIWNCKGTPYEVSILEVHSEYNPLPTRHAEWPT